MSFATFALGLLIFGSFFGLIAADSRPALLKYLEDQMGPPQVRRHRERLLYGLFGGFVAGVFQMAQYQTLAPIQALVLGATWYSVITNIMTGSRPMSLTASEIVDRTPQAVPTPPNATASAVEFNPPKSP